MKVVMCPKGHYYDGDKFSDCPHCNEGINTSSSRSSAIKIERSVIYEERNEGQSKQPVSSETSQPHEVKRNLLMPNMRVRPDATVDEDNDMPRTVAYNSKPKRVMGWLVMIDGPMYGDFIPLYDDSNEVNGAVIRFDSGTKKFIADVFNSGTRFDLDSRTLSENEFLYHHSRIRLKGVTYVLVELCREGFDWDSKSVLDSGFDRYDDNTSGQLKSNKWLCDICCSYNDNSALYCEYCGARKGGNR